MKQVDEKAIQVFQRSLQRCEGNPRFLDRFYKRFLESSPKIRRKFEGTDFDRQKKLLNRSFHLILWASEDPDDGPERYLEHLAVRHSASDLKIGSELYDLWLDSLLGVVEECDPEFDSEVEEAWEAVMGIGIDYMLSRYHHS